MSELDPVDVAIAKRARDRELAAIQENHAAAMRRFNSPENLSVLREGRAPAYAPPVVPDRIGQLKGLSDAELVEAYRHVIDGVGESKLHDGYVSHSAVL